jgi:AcrR family transcriptional regulator
MVAYCRASGLRAERPVLQGRSALLARRPGAHAGKVACDVSEVAATVTPTLQSRKAEAVRTLVFEALAAEMTTSGLEFTMQGVADRAGVSYRTVYRYFPTREGLVRGLIGWLEEQLALRRIEAADDIAEVVRHNYRRLEEHADTIAPIIKAGITTEGHRDYARDRTEQFMAALAGEIAHLPSEVGRAVAWTIRHLGSNQTWMRLHEDAEIDGACSGAAVAWAIDTLLAALRAGQGPRSCAEDDVPQE